MLINLVEALDDHDDVQNVFSDFDLSDEELARTLARMIVLGVDPGTHRSGWGVVRRAGPRLQGSTPV